MSSDLARDPHRLTQWAHGGGCGCKIAPAVLQRLLAQVPPHLAPPQLLVGTATSDDAAVWQLRDDLALVATTDFFTPVVDDAFDFGAIAATNALSDVYAMGGQPLLALALVGMPVNQLPHEVIARVLEGGAAACRDAGVALAGGHSIDTVEPIYGLAAIGTVHPRQVKTNAGAQPGDVLVLGKPLGIGVLSAALKKGLLDADGYAPMRRWTTLLNRAGAALAALPQVHAMTDVTGFGLAGHLLEMARAARLDAHVQAAAVPVLELSRAFVAQGIATGASARNWASYGHEVDLTALPESERATWQTLLTDPQTSGGLLVACAPPALEAVQAAFTQAQGQPGWVIGRMTAPAAAKPTLRVH
ncbi:Selenide, water dikinase [Tepidimonas alkaliphilus]|uniref:Selenide, water dikinase n=1 Tax=Tepidimonas alkaliphilus TaxID=2588942 RepID=A0A554WBH1_9BURK|nr:selenide, water dikinase SelD [Tepidimonas alkaliphilus]TSE20915.1 Selenide, water dikinase [Tepidimonas alkaliphilus]